MEIQEGIYETVDNGVYHFDVSMHEDYTITPSKDKNPLNGVITFDLVLISKHILGVKSFDSPYQWIAADVNQSKTVTAYDIVQLRRLILNIDEDFTHNTSWRFISADQVFAGENPLTASFDEFYQINNISSNHLMDFIGVKIGDVNGNASTNSLHQTEVRNSQEVFHISVDNQALKAGQTYELTFSTQQLAQIQGYQFTLQADKVRIDQVGEGIMKLANLGLQGLDRGQITTSWNYSTVGGGRLSAVGSTEELFTLQVLALEDVQLSEVLTIQDQPTSVEAYDAAGNTMQVQLDFQTATTLPVFELYQNEPNPFNSMTTIKYVLPADSEARLILRDEAGRVLQTIRQAGITGKNQFQLNELDLPAGFIYYQLITKFGTKSKKMLSVK